MPFDDRFLCEDRFASRANSPVARSVRGLIPNTRYALYVGGVGASDVLLNYATFNTLPENDADVRCLFVNGARVDKVSLAPVPQVQSVLTLQRRPFSAHRCPRAR